MLPLALRFRAISEESGKGIRENIIKSFANYWDKEDTQEEIDKVYRIT